MCPYKLCLDLSYHCFKSFGYYALEGGCDFAEVSEPLRCSWLESDPERDPDPVPDPEPEPEPDPERDCELELVHWPEFYLKSIVSLKS